MPKATLTFNLPEERSEYHAAAHGQDWKGIVFEMAQYLRSALKYGHEHKTADAALEAVRDKLWDMCKDEGLDPWED